MDPEDQEMQQAQDSVAVEEVENLVLSFLTQLVDVSSLPDPNEILSARQRRAKSKIQIQLANRTKGSSKTLTYPKKCASGSVRPLGECIYAVYGWTNTDFEEQHSYSAFWTLHMKQLSKIYQ